MFYFHVINFNFYFSKNKFQLNIFLTYFISIIYNEQLNFYFLINETIILFNHYEFSLLIFVINLKFHFLMHSILYISCNKYKL